MTGGGNFHPSGRRVNTPSQTFRMTKGFTLTIPYNCGRCGQHDPKGDRAHVCPASNSESASNNGYASNTGTEAKVRASGRVAAPSRPASVGAGPSAVGPLHPSDDGARKADATDVGRSEVDGRVVPKQRWGRDKYNAYQREYMRKRRAK